MRRSKRKDKLVKVLAAIQGKSLNDQADYILNCHFDYVPYIATLTANRTIEHLEKQQDEDYREIMSYILKDED